MFFASLISTIGVSNVQPRFYQTIRSLMLQHSSRLTSKNQSACKTALLQQTGYGSVPGNGDTLFSHVRQLQHSFTRTALWPQHKNQASSATAATSAHWRSIHQSSCLPPLSGQFRSSPQIRMLDICTLQTSKVSSHRDGKHSMRV